MRVLALSKYPRAAASTRQRFLLYADAMARAGIAFDLAPLVDSQEFATIAQGRRVSPMRALVAYAHRVARLAQARSHDLIWIQYELFPFAPALFERLAFMSGRPVVVDYDDAIFHGYDLSSSSAVRSFLGHKLDPLMQGARLVMCGNAYIAAHVAARGGRTLQIPTVVDVRRYLQAPVRRTGRPTIGWIGSPSTWPYLEQVLPALRSVAARHDARILIVGAGPSASAAHDVEVVPWAEETEVDCIREMDVGIMPLPDTPWARGKCGYKLIQYMACGLPVVASPVGVNVDLLAGGTTGLAGTDPAHFAEAVGRLLIDADLRERMGLAGRRLVESHYSLAAQEGRFITALQSAAGLL